MTSGIDTTTPTPKPGHVGPVAATIGVVFKDGRVLLVRRRNEPDAGYWGFPGGKIDRGESITAAATREIFEETSVTAEAVKIFTAVDVLDKDKGGALRHHFVLIAVLCHWVAGEPVAGDDALEARWWDLDSLDEAGLVMSFGVMEVVREAYALSTSRSC
ncbi:NUDIX hydrolase [Pandoraea apista]|uniref:NUDIX domain-containing protein n=1 Tax=Pandoraea apista TaxID=93218 RepID=A0ABX9ZJ44_9BURK|nr:NUDIX hydrolase [Pandoraea apista]PTD98563.1 ADP-ribose pyrophosphatase [Pandoraea apista]RRJ27652.1 NUDIX domain-containing protein [Pandoraea apista]RRJ73102.1 NUDIX domain-containing protein [Pandoraea apista]RSD06606.1 NUDIX domain-containing protein [Pandoraea apista]RSD10117.1 NUDIX domain-containing protein [Pandoraea apista]